MKRRKLRTALCVLLAGTVLAAFVAIAAEAGSQGDPLVTLSYLNDTFLGQLLGKVDSKLTQRDQALRQELEQQGAVFQCTSDTEVIAFLIAKERLTADSVEEAVARVAPRLEGSFSLLVMSPKKLIALRDPKGMRPLCMGHLGKSPVFASESCALDSIGASFDRDVRPGELIVVDESGERVMESGINPDASKCALCVFEHIYFARPDSVIDGQSVYQARLEAGRILARSHPVQADLVIGVPDSGLAAAIGFAQESGIPYGEGLVKNRYIGRTFIQPTQNGRESAVSIKLSALRRSVEGKRVVMIDDSIVRGTTMRQIVDLLKKAGATEVHVRISAPEFLWPCYYGTDIDDRSQLASVKFTHADGAHRRGQPRLPAAGAGQGNRKGQQAQLLYRLLLRRLSLSGSHARGQDRV